MMEYVVVNVRIIYECIYNARRKHFRTINFVSSEMILSSLIAY